MAAVSTLGRAPMDVSPVTQTAPVRHERLYINDDAVVFQVENTLFRVHKHFLRTWSPFFEAMFSSSSGPSNRPPTSTGQMQEGKSDARPIKLEGVKAIDFERLLTLFYPTKVLQEELTTAAEWLSVLDLSTRWKIDVFRERAINHLQTMLSAVDRVVYSQKFNIEAWLIPAYIELIRRDSSLTLAENTALGMKNATILANARVGIRGSHDGVSDTTIIECINKAKHQMVMKAPA